MAGEIGPVEADGRDRRRREPGPEVAADEHAARRTGSRVAEEGSQLGAEGELVDAGPLDGTAQGEERAARVIRCPDLAPPGRAEAGDEGDLRQRLDVVDERGPAVHSPLVGPWGNQCRLGLAAVEELDQCRFLAGHVLGWRRHELQGDRVIGSRRGADVRSEGDPPCCSVHATWPVGAHGGRRRHGPVEHQVGR
jgi:hypothetical protein